MWSDDWFCDEPLEDDVLVDQTGALTALYNELIKPKLSSTTLINTLSYGDPLGGNADVWEQPFAVVVHPQVALVVDMHAHACDAEVIGLLAGRWDRDNNCLYIQAPFPCSATGTGTDKDGSTTTDVELDHIAGN